MTDTVPEDWPHAPQPDANGRCTVCSLPVKDALHDPAYRSVAR